MFVLKEISEVNRYELLSSQKNYSSDYWGGVTLCDIFSEMFSEKIRAISIGEVYDNLLNSDIRAPKLLPPEQIDYNFRKFIGSLS